MSGPRSETNDNLLLIAATAIAVLTLQRYFQASTPPPSPSAEPARLHQPLASLDALSGELSRSEHGRLSRDPLQIP
jgi:hypothetical protein